MANASSHPRALRRLGTLNPIYDESLLVLASDPFADEHVAPAGYAFLGVREAVSVLRTTLYRDHEALCALFCRVLNTSPYERAEDMLDALEDALGHVFWGDTDPPRFARILLARRALPKRSCARGDARDADAVQPLPAPAPLTWIELETVREDGKPAALTRCTVETANGEKHSLMTDAQGRIRLDGIAPGECRVRFPELARKWNTPLAAPAARERR
jgi:hypothetical protein